MNIPVINPQKLRDARGDRTQREIVCAVNALGGKLFEQQLSAYERGHYRPRPETLPFLLEALGVEFEDIVSPIDFSNAA